MTPRRILIFSLTYYPRFVGGAEVAIKEITDRIPASEIEFDMVSLRLDSNLPKFEKVGNVNVYRIGWALKQETHWERLPWRLHINKYVFLLTGFCKALSLNRVRRYDAIWSLMASYNSFAALFFKLVHPKTPFIFTLQDGDPIPYIKRRARPLWPFFKMMFTRADRIQAISTYLADWAREMGAKCPIDIIPNGVDYRLFSSENAAKGSDSLKEKLGKKPDDIFLITTSRLVHKNAVDDIVSALQYLPANVKLLVIGSGALEGELKEQAIKLKLNSKDSNSVLFIGFVQHADLPNYLKSSDIFVRPSRSEGLGNSFLEAMAAGIPVIATAVGGIPDFLKDGETGLFCEVDNPRSIAQKVEKLLKDKESREYIVKNARKMVEEKYQWEAIAERMKEIFESASISN